MTDNRAVSVEDSGYHMYKRLLMKNWYNFMFAISIMRAKE